jgi:hypothetical protein
MVGPPGWGVGEGLKNLHRKKEQIVTKWYTGPRNLGVDGRIILILEWTLGRRHEKV